jgi:hypothetical protein
MVGFAAQRAKVGRPMPGLIEAKRSLPAGAVIEDLYTLASCSLPGEWEGQVIYLPL